MRENDRDKYRFPKTLDLEKRLFGLPTDEALLIIVPALIFGYFKFYLTGIIIGTLLMLGLKFLKKGKPSSYLYNSLYWVLPPITGVFKKIPLSHLRRWIK